VLNQKHILIVALVSMVSCKEPYEPAILSSPDSSLVVEGLLNVNGATSIKLSRTTPLENSRVKWETGAQVDVEGKDNSIRSLVSNGTGIYSSPDLNLVAGDEYRLRIRTSVGKEYLSDFVTALQTPPIDSVSWLQEPDGLHLYVGTHDPLGNTRYYRWEYEETWEVWSFYIAGWLYIPASNTVRRILPQEDASVGWKFDSSKNILVGTSASLASDIIFPTPVNFIPSGHEKLGVRYSILVRQYALDKSGYEFYDQMKKNTESLGTIFDPQPTETGGNIACINDPDEKVLGYISAASSQEKRIFISNQELELWRFRQDCPSRNVLNHPDSIRLAFQGSLLPWDVIYSMTIPGEISHYVSSYGRCVDVTRREATLVKPSYW